MAETVKQQNSKAIIVFKPSGQVVEVEIGSLLADAAIEALNGREVGGRAMRINEARPRGGR